MIIAPMIIPHDDSPLWIVGGPAVNLMRGIPFAPSPADVERNDAEKFSHNFLGNDVQVYRWQAHKM